ncbi:SOS response-associated peptidase family protein [Enterococcus sp. LJL51]|uniref:SOS response-associated peptidase family protein n=1 Tax=Enterococcus sp. LJL51 TaxID=3416656 RepID=UPI003CFAD5CD
MFPTSGFYEWNGQKEKFLFTEGGSELLYLAGSYKKFDDGQRSIILTTAANDSVEQIHKRMPVIIEKKAIDAWLSDEEFAEDYLKKEMPKLISKVV